MAGDLYSLRGKRVFVAGHRGMVGSALVRRLAREDCTVLTVDRATVDLARPDQLGPWMAEARPQVVILAAARVGGIAANMARPVDFLHDNVAIATTVMAAAHAADVEKLLYLGSSCLYPRAAAQPITEDALLTGPLEPTNAPYAVAKIAGVTLAQAYRRQYGRDVICAMPTNLYGPGDTFDPETAHVPAALIRRLHEARDAGAAEAVVWGSGRPRRDFLHVDDAADACVTLLRRWSDARPVNIGSGTDIAIADFARMVAEVVGYRGRLTFDTSRPDGMPRKLLDITILRSLGWHPRMPLQAGLADAYRWFLDTH